MFDKLETVEARYEELTKMISDPEVIANQAEWQKLIKEHNSIEEVVQKYREYKKEKQRMEDAKELMQDPEMKELAEIDYYEAKEKIPHIEEELKILLIPKDPNDDKNVICEIRGGAGGEEAALFAGTLFRMYSMYAERKHWKIEILNENETELGGYKEISFMVTGKGAYSRLKFESGVHRVQRVPDTESSGRIHTSTATVAVLPVVEDVEIDINPADIKMEVFRASGAGGQHVNKTSSAVRLIHEPTGITVECQTERSQLQNREYAMKMLRSRLYNIEKEKQDSEIASARKTQVGSGDRSEKIRTYNYPQGRITDHRIGMSIFQMENFLNGDIDEMLDNLAAADRAERLNDTSGITLIALVVTIVVILILAGVSLRTLSGKDDLLNNTEQAKELTENRDEKEQLNIAVTEAMTLNKWGEVTKENLQNELDKNIGQDNYTLTGEGPYTIIFKKSDKRYEVTIKGEIK